MSTKPVDIGVIRYELAPTYTLGTVAIDGKPFGYSCEDVDRGLDQSMSLADIAAGKVKTQTAIPAGTYKLGVRYSPKHNAEVVYLRDVPGFQFIEIHAGNTSADTDGCLLFGLHPGAGCVTDSRKAMTWFDSHVLPYVRMYGGTITITRA